MMDRFRLGYIAFHPAENQDSKPGLNLNCKHCAISPVALPADRAAHRRSRDCGASFLLAWNWPGDRDRGPRPGLSPHPGLRADVGPGLHPHKRDH